MHIIAGLGDGGAEAVLYNLCVNDKHNQHEVISMMSMGKYGPLLTSSGINVLTLGMTRGKFSLVSMVKMFIYILQRRDCVVQTWMYHGDLLGGLPAYIARVRGIVWGIHNTVLESGKSKYSTILIAKISAMLSKWLPNKIVVCSRRAIDVHEKLGYDISKMVFVPNGYDINRFIPDSISKTIFRESLNLPSVLPVIGLVGRYDPFKDHDNLLSALFILKKRDINIYCLLAGNGVDSKNVEFVNKITLMNLTANVILLGQRSDIPALMNCLDVFVLSSSAEAFPNVVCEAMACGTPCVVTDVGDARDIVGDTGWVVPPKDPLALANAIEGALRQLNGSSWMTRCKSARRRILENYTINKMLDDYSRVWAGASSKN